MSENSLAQVPGEFVELVRLDEGLTPDQLALVRDFRNGMTTEHREYISGPFTDGTQELFEEEGVFWREIAAVVRTASSDAVAEQALLSAVNDPERAIDLARIRVTLAGVAQLALDRGADFEQYSQYAFTGGPQGLSVLPSGVCFLSSYVARTANGIMRTADAFQGKGPRFSQKELEAASISPGGVIDASSIASGIRERAGREELKSAIDRYLEELVPFLGKRSYSRASYTAGQLQLSAATLGQIGKHLERFSYDVSNLQLVEALRTIIKNCEVELARIGLYFIKLQGPQVDLFANKIDLKAQLAALEAAGIELREAKAAYESKMRLARKMPFGNLVIRSQHPDSRGDKAGSLISGRDVFRALDSVRRGLSLKVALR